MRQEAFKFPPIKESDLFRIEHESDMYSRQHPVGVGVYQRSYLLMDVPYSERCPETGSELTPGPYDDGELLPALHAHGHDLTRACFFGFGSLDAMKSWFRSPRFWDSLKRAGMVVRRYRGVVFHGRRQSVIDTTYLVQRLEVVAV